MTEKLQQVAARFREDEFSYNPIRYAEYVHELLDMGTPLGSEPSYFELLERVIEMLWHCQGPQLRSAEMDRLLSSIQVRWSPDLPSHERASLVNIAAYMLPHEATRQWLYQQADATQGELSAYLRKTAASQRKQYAT